MTRITWTFASRGAEVRPPTLRVLLAPVATTAGRDGEPAAQWLDEIHAACWEPLELTWGSNGRPSTLKLRRVLGAAPGKPSRNRPEETFCMPGDRVRLVESRAGGPNGTAAAEWFRGYVAQDRVLVEADAAGDREEYHVVAYGPEILLKNKVVSGQWHARPAADAKLVAGQFAAADLVRENTFRSRLAAIFNEHGRPNASAGEVGQAAADWALDSGAEPPARAGRTFEPRGRTVGGDATYQADFWRARQAVQSLLEIVDDYQVLSPSSAAGLAGLAGRTLGEVNVEGLDLLEALAAVLLPIGWGFAVEPWAQADGRHNLRVFELHGSPAAATVRRPFMAPIGGRTPTIGDGDAQRAEVQRIEFVRDNHNVANDVTVIGSQRRRQVVLCFQAADGQLQPAWDSDLYSLSQWASDGVVDPMHWPLDEQEERTVEFFDRYFSYSSRSSGARRHAFRSFVWNEDGAFNAVCQSMGDAAAFGVTDADTAQGDYVRRPRPVAATLLRDDASPAVRNLPAFVQLGIDGDENSWIQVPAVIWPDRAGLTIPVDPLYAWHPYATDYARHAGHADTSLFEAYAAYSYLTLLNNTLADTGLKLILRLVGSIECDEALTARAERRLGSSWPLAARKVIRSESRFVLRDVPDGSDPLDLGEGRHDTRDDTDDATDLAERVRGALEDEVAHGSILLRHLSRAYAPGDVIPQTQGRVIDLTVRGGQRRYAPVVVGVTWRFAPGGNKTELLLDTPAVGLSR